MYLCEMTIPDLTLTEAQRATIRAVLQTIWPTLDDKSTHGLVCAYNAGKDLPDRINGATADIIWPPEERPLI